MKDIKGYEGKYAITSCGKVWSYISKKFLKPVPTHDEYMYVCLHKDGRNKCLKLHRLVAEAYIPNPDGLETVDHIDGNKNHNYVRNLRWMTREDNARRAQNKKIRCIETGEVFESATAAAKEMNISRGNISSTCSGRRKMAGGYHFEFVKE